MDERKKALEILTSEKFCDLTPHKVVAMLADEQTYICSASMMYKLLRCEGLLKHRGRSKPREYLPKIETMAMGPNQLWCWDITYLPNVIRGQSFKLYLFADVFSRKIVGWEIARTESETVAAQLLEKSIKSEGISGKNLRLHNDNGNPMKSFTFVEKAKSLGVIQSFSRPRVKNDNAFAEALFKTLKYRPEYPYRAFKSIEEARAWVSTFTRWYNFEHLHSTLGYVTPIQKHSGQDDEILANRREVFAQAKKANPNRWTKHAKPWKPQSTVRFNSNSCRLRT